jgi:acetolactate synthase I/II/III large subunit
MIKRVADIVMEVLVRNGIKACFAVVGGGAMHLDNALALCPDIDKYFDHHEQACAMAAEAYARVSGDLAAVCVTSGPGGTNAITGVMGAWQDSLPMLVLSGQVRYETTVESSGLPLRYRGVQEFDIVNSVRNMTKYAKTVTDPLSIVREVQKGIDLALSGRRGPVWIDVPLNVQSAKVEEADLYPAGPPEVLPEPSAEDVDWLMRELAAAKRPCLLAGNGIANSHTTDSFRALADVLQVPVIAAAIAADAMYRDHPLYFGLSGSIGPRPGNFIVQNADLVVSLGCTLGFKMSGFAQDQFAPKARIVAVDIDEAEFRKPGVRVDRLIRSDLAAFFRRAQPAARAIPVDPAWMDYCVRLRDRFSPFEPGEGLDPADRVGSYRFWKVFEEHEPEDGIVVLGNNTANSAKLQIGVKRPLQRVVANNNCGSMGADLPETIGAAVASKRTVVCATGDGSIMMNLQELQTIRHYGLPAKIIVFSNDGYAAIRQTCKNFFNGTYIGCTADSGISFPSFEKVAGTFGLPYRFCGTNGELDAALDWLFGTEGAVLLEIAQRFDDPVTPKVMSRLNPDGSFSTPALQDMYPFLEKEDYDSLMLWP